MRRMKCDDGAVAVIVALLAVALFGFGALVIDVGALYSERRQLQNGADAGALAVAQACAAGDCGTYLADARGFANGNSLDAVSRVEDGEVCGTAPLPACAEPPGDLPGDGYVQVTSRTREQDGSTLVPPFLARILSPDYTGTDVGARATVVWGAPGGVHTELAITFSQCEYDKLTEDANGGKVYATEPYDPALQRTIFFHDTAEASTCPGGPSGADLPGGFGWLDADANSCTAAVEDGWAGADTGASASQDCKAALKALLGKTVLIPVFKGVNGLSGTNGQYDIWSYVGFVLTGWNFPGTKQPSAYSTATPNPCKPSQTCLAGFFTEVVVPATGPVTDGPNQGVTVTQLVS